MELLWFKISEKTKVFSTVRFSNTKATIIKKRTLLDKQTGLAAKEKLLKC